MNTKATVFLTQLLLPHLKNGGRILNISTGLAHSSLPAMAAYGISKAALFMRKECCNAEFKNQGIVAASAMPGVVDTSIQKEMRSYDPARFPAVGAFRGFMSEKNC